MRRDSIAVSYTYRIGITSCERYAQHSTIAEVIDEMTFVELDECIGAQSIVNIVNPE